MRLAQIVLLSGLAAIGLCDGARAAEYGALAVGVSGAQVGTGITLNYSTQAAADASAIKECEVRSHKCEVVGQFSNGGCGYVALAIARGTCWGAGTSAEAAVLQCQAKGCGECKAPIFGCLKKR